MNTNNFCEITPEIARLAELSQQAATINPDLFSEYDVKRGLRDLNGKGVLVGLTEISDVCSTRMENGKSVPAPGELYYRGYNVKDIIRGLSDNAHFGFEESTYLLLFGKLPSQQELTDFCTLLATYRSLPTSFVRDIIMKAPSQDMMNTLARSVLTLYSYDDRADDISIPNVLRQCLELISLFPLLSVYGYQAYRHYHDGASLFIHTPGPELSTAETILHILRPDSNYTPLEAKLLDISLILHMEHGGGNNSTFTTHLVSSSGTDTYSAIAASLGSLKGPKHGGANIKVVKMFEDMKEHIHDWNDEEEIGAYLTALLHKEAFDRAGLIYGPCGIFSVRSPCGTVPYFCGTSFQRKGTGGRICPLLYRGTSGSPDHCKRTENIQRGEPQCGLFLRICLQYAESSSGTLHPYFCHRKNFRLERPPSGRTELQW